MIRYIITGLVLFFVSLIFPSGLIAQKTDTVLMMNGNIITGEIKSYNYGILNYKIDGMGTVQIEQQELSTIRSNKFYEFRMNNGIILYGSMDTSMIDKFVYLVFANSKELVDFRKIVQITPIKKRFWARFDGRVDLGFSYTKASEVAQLTFNGNLDYKGRKFRHDLRWSSIITDQELKDVSRNNNINLSINRLLKNTWYGTGIVFAEQNSELGLDLRTSVALGVSNIVVYTHRMNLFTTAGLTANREWSNGKDTPTDNLEGYLFIQYKIYKYFVPKINLTTYAILYPSFTIPGRVRINYNLKTNFELISDFYLSLTFYINYDNKPQGDNTNNTDYGTTLSVGYSF